MCCGRWTGDLAGMEATKGSMMVASAEGHRAEQSSEPFTEVFFSVSIIFVQSGNRLSFKNDNWLDFFDNRHARFAALRKPFWRSNVFSIPPRAGLRDNATYSKQRNQKSANVPRHQVSPTKKNSIRKLTLRHFWVYLYRC